jgi:hypothetical protein
MIDSLRTIRLSRVQLGVVALLSVAATGLIIASALGHTAAQKAAVAALHNRPMLVRFTGSSGSGNPHAGARPLDSGGQPGSARLDGAGCAQPAECSGEYRQQRDHRDYRLRDHHDDQSDHDDEPEYDYDRPEDPQDPPRVRDRAANNELR